MHAFPGMFIYHLNVEAEVWGKMKSQIITFQMTRVVNASSWYSSQRGSMHRFYICIEISLCAAATVVAMTFSVSVEM
jgi:hypothetical protein